MLYNVKMTVYKREMEIDADTEGEALEIFRNRVMEEINDDFLELVDIDEIETENPYKKDYNWRDFI